MAQQAGTFKVKSANLVSRTRKLARNEGLGALLRPVGGFNFPAAKL